MTITTSNGRFLQSSRRQEGNSIAARRCRKNITGADRPYSFASVSAGVPAGASRTLSRLIRDLGALINEGHDGSITIRNLADQAVSTGGLEHLLNAGAGEHECSPLFGHAGSQDGEVFRHPFPGFCYSHPQGWIFLRSGSSPWLPWEEKRAPGGTDYPRTGACGKASVLPGVAVVILNFLIKLVSILHSGKEPRHLAGGFALGTILGLTPLLSLQNALVICLILLLDVSISGALFGMALFAAFAYLLDPLFNQLGYFLLVNVEFLRPFWAYLYNVPIAPLTKFYNTVVLGSLVSALSDRE